MQLFEKTNTGKSHGNLKDKFKRKLLKKYNNNQLRAGYKYYENALIGCEYYENKIKNITRYT